MRVRLCVCMTQRIACAFSLQRAEQFSAFVRKKERESLKRAKDAVADVHGAPSLRQPPRSLKQQSMLDQMVQVLRPYCVGC